MDALLSSLMPILTSGNASEQLNQDKINELLELSTDALLCDQVCQKQRIADELKQRYLEAETNVAQASAQVDQSEKNYVVYTKGRPYYDAMQAQQLEKQADEIGKRLDAAFSSELQKAHSLNQLYNVALINSSHTHDLASTYRTKVTEMRYALKQNKDDVLTNDRRTQYETDAIQHLHKWHTILAWVYMILAIVLTLFLVITPSVGSIAHRVGIILLLWLFPRFIDPLYRWIHSWYQFIVQLMPMTVYHQL